MRHALRPTIALAALAALTVLASSAGATTMLKLDLPMLSKHSEQIVRGHVIGMEPRLEAGRVSTYVTLRVAERYKGTGGETVTLRRLGGRVGGIATHVSGATPFTPGEHVVVFLERPQSGDTLIVTGMKQGKFSVSQGPDGSTLFVVPDVDGVHLVEPTPEATDEISERIREAKPSGDHSRVWALPEFVSRLEAIEGGATQ